MKKDYNKETGITTWTLNGWGQKTLYVIGWITFVYVAGAFLIGIMLGLASL